jgi:diaminopimelate decarboxylase
MVHYSYANAQLFCEAAAITTIAAAVPTPFYLYSRKTYLENYEQIDAAFGSRPHRICYALKANSNLDLLRDFAAKGAGADVVSVGELKLALRAGIPAQAVVFAGVGKRDDEILAGLAAGIRGFNVESEAELEVINDLARQRGVQARVALRVNPNIDIHGHPYISTGRSADKFGIELERVRGLLREVRELEHLKLAGLHSHIGSLITEITPYAEVGKVMASLAHEAVALGHELDYIDVGGGLGVIYENAIPVAPNTAPVQGFALSPNEVAEQLVRPMTGLRCELIFEPGRALAATCGALITRVLYLKQSGGKRFVVVDASMSDLIRPSLYRAYHQIVPVQLQQREREKCEIVGPVCESGDFFAKDRELERVERGELLAIMTAGAYGFSLSSNYNARPRPAEVIVEGKRFKISRPRQELERVWE